MACWPRKHGVSHPGRQGSPPRVSWRFRVNSSRSGHVLGHGGRLISMRVLWVAALMGVAGCSGSVAPGAPAESLDSSGGGSSTQTGTGTGSSSSSTGGVTTGGATGVMVGGIATTGSGVYTTSGGGVYTTSGGGTTGAAESSSGSTGTQDAGSAVGIVDAGMGGYDGGMIVVQSDATGVCTIGDVWCLGVPASALGWQDPATKNIDTFAPVRCVRDERGVAVWAYDPALCIFTKCNAPGSGQFPGCIGGGQRCDSSPHPSTGASVCY